MKIGIFDSGLGGLIIAKAIRRKMPKYDYVYLGDTKRVPYGPRSHEAVYEFTKEGINYLFKKEKCAMVVLACNTASARALERLQKENKKIIGVLIPAAEEAAKFYRVGIIGTLGTVHSGAFPKEIRKINKEVKVFQNSAPMLVPLAEEGENSLALPFIQKYLDSLRKKNIQALVLGCTHYPIFKKEIKKALPKSIKIISQDEIIPLKLKEYLNGHREIEKKLSKNGTAKILVTDITQNIKRLSEKWFGKIKPKLVQI